MRHSWTNAALGDVALINPRTTDRPAHDTPTSFVPMAALNADAGRVAAEETRPYGVVEHGYTLFRQNDILVAKITPCFENGKIGRASIHHPLGSGSTEFHVVRPDPERLDRGYALHFLRRLQVRKAGTLRMTGSAGQRRVPENFLATLRLPLPPLKDQRRIAQVLDRAERLRTKRRESIGIGSSLRAAVLVERLALADCRLVPLRELVLEFRYGTSSKSGATGLPALRIPNVVGDDLDLSELKTVDLRPAEVERLTLADGDLLFVRTNGNPQFVGRCGLFTRQAVISSGFDPERFVYASYLIRARPDISAVSPDYLCEFLRSSSATRELRAAAKTSAGQFNLNIQGLGAISVRLPPRRIQEDIVAALWSIKRTIARQRSHLRHLDVLAESLQHRAFSGEL